MKKRFLVLVSAFVMMFFFAGTASAYLTYGANQMGFINYENIFNSKGLEKSVDDFLDPNQGIEIGDTFVGILGVLDIRNQNNQQTFFPSPTEQILGVFAQEVKEIDIDATGEARLTLGAASLTQFTTTAGDLIDTGLSGNEMFALYLEDSQLSIGGPGVTLANSFDAAKDGNLWMTLGYDPGAGGDWGDGDDDGYFYSYVTPFGTAIDNFEGIVWGGLNMIQNNTDWDFTGVNNVDENEVSGPGGTVPGLMTDWYLKSILSSNKAEESPWLFESNDPANTNVVPEPGTLFLLGLGLIGVAGIGRRRVQ